MFCNVEKMSTPYFKTSVIKHLVKLDHLTQNINYIYRMCLCAFTSSCFSLT